MNTHDIQAFVAVVDTGSIVGAATRLHLTQPGISRRIQSLEATLGVTLLERQSKPLKPTSEGRNVYTLGQRVLRSVDALVGSTDERREFAGALRLGVSSVVSEPVLAEPVDSLLAAYPRLALKISTAWSPLLLAQVQNKLLDAAVIVMPGDSLPDPALPAYKLAEQATLIVASNTLPVAQSKEEVTLAALAQHQWILNQDGCGIRGALRAKLAEAGLPFNIAVEVIGAELQLSLVSRGMGLGLVTAAALARSAFRRELVVLPVAAFRNQAALWLVHGAQPGRLEGPLDTLRQSLGKLSAY